MYLILLLCLEMVAGAKERVYSADIVVYGNSSSAVVAAVQVARMGKKLCWSLRMLVWEV